MSFTTKNHYMILWFSTNLRVSEGECRVKLNLMRTKEFCISIHWICSNDAFNTQKNGFVWSCWCDTSIQTRWIILQVKSYTFQLNSDIHRKLVLDQMMSSFTYHLFTVSPKTVPIVYHPQETFLQQKQLAAPVLRQIFYQESDLYFQRLTLPTINSDFNNNHLLIEWLCYHSQFSFQFQFISFAIK